MGQYDGNEGNAGNTPATSSNYLPVALGSGANPTASQLWFGMLAPFTPMRLAGAVWCVLGVRTLDVLSLVCVVQLTLACVNALEHASINSLIIPGTKVKTIVGHHTSTRAFFQQ